MIRVFCYLKESICYIPFDFHLLKGSSLPVGMLSSSLGFRTQPICPGGHRLALSNVIGKASSAWAASWIPRWLVVGGITMGGWWIPFTVPSRIHLTISLDWGTLLLLRQLPLPLTFSFCYSRATVFPAVVFPCALYHCHVVDKLSRWMEVWVRSLGSWITNWKWEMEM